MVRLIDAYALINELNNSHYPGAPYIDAGISIAIGKVCEAPTVEPELVWHECFDEDPASFPDNERNVLVSFSNFSLSIIGQWRVDEDGAGCWYLGDTDETFLSEGLFVDGWWELPKKPERRE